MDVREFVKEVWNLLGWPGQSTGSGYTLPRDIEPNTVSRQDQPLHHTPLSLQNIGGTKDPWAGAKEEKMDSPNLTPMPPLHTVGELGLDLEQRRVPYVSEGVHAGTDSPFLASTSSNHSSWHLRGTMLGHMRFHSHSSRLRSIVDWLSVGDPGFMSLHRDEVVGYRYRSKSRIL